MVEQIEVMQVKADQTINKDLNKQKEDLQARLAARRKNRQKRSLNNSNMAFDEGVGGHGLNQNPLARPMTSRGFSSRPFFRGGGGRDDLNDISWIKPSTNVDSAGNQEDASFSIDIIRKL